MKSSISTIVLGILALLTLGVSYLEIHSTLVPGSTSFTERELVHVTVEGDSMTPTLTDGQVLIGDASTEAIENIAAGDIILLHEPDSAIEETYLIKRVVGLAGDVIEIKYGKLYVNGYYKDYGGRFLDDYGPYTVEEDAVFVLGDNPMNSLDSRYFRSPSVPVTEIVGIILMDA